MILLADLRILQPLSLFRLFLSLISTQPVHAAQKGVDAQGLGRSRGGLRTKIHAAGVALGLPVRLIASPWQRNDIAYAHELIDGLQAECTIADKGYDANHLINKIVEIQAAVVIPPAAAIRTLLCEHLESEGAEGCHC